jgi:hypothetical protein
MRYSSVGPLAANCLLVALGSCGILTPIVTRWDLMGSWSGSVTFPDGSITLGESNVSVFGGSRGRVRFCNLAEGTFGLPFSSMGRDELAGVQVRTDQPLCETRSRTIVGGSGVTWAHPTPQDTLALVASISDQWTLNGEINVTSYSKAGPPDLNVGNSATVERLTGTFMILAMHQAGTVYRFEGDTFELSVILRKFERYLAY